PLRAMAHLGADAGEPPPLRLAPFKTQITACPVLVLYQRTSPNPSRLKSPVPATIQGLAAVPGEPPPITLVPLSSHTASCPLVPLRQRMSLLPSPLKSRCPTIAQGLGAVPGEPPPITLGPFTSQATVCPFVLLYQSTSLFPSPLKSWMFVGAMLTLALLFTVFGSNWSLCDIAAVLVDGIGEAAVAVIVNVCAPPVVTVPTVQTAVLGSYDPWLGVAITNVKPTGSTSCTATLVAAKGPRLFSAMVKRTLVLTCGAGLLTDLVS